MLAIKDHDLPENQQNIAPVAFFQELKTVPAVKEYLRLLEYDQLPDDPWTSASAQTRQKAQNRELVCKEVHKLISSMSLTRAIDAAISSNVVHVKAALSTLGFPKKGAVRIWYNTWVLEGKTALLPGYSGTKRKDYGWEALFLKLYHKGSKPALRKVARDLREDYGFDTATENNVRYFFEKLPAQLQDKSPWRLGRKIYNDGVREFVLRTTENLPVGFLFQGDGHTIDVYLKHPVTGNLWRAELTVFMDVRSRFIVGWYLSVAESAVTTMAALSNALGTHDHVCAWVHIDNGSGFFNQMMSAKVCGFYAKFGIEIMAALPGNAKSKNVERFFRTMEDDFGKDWATYCGYDMSPDEMRKFSSKKARQLEAEGKLKIPTVEQWCEGFRDWLEKYHNRPHPEEENTTPAQLWSQLEREPVHDYSLLVKPRQKVNVRRSMIELHKRFYRSDLLYQFEGNELIAEYDLHDDSTIRVFDIKGRWLLTAELKARKDFIPMSRIEEGKIKRAAAARKRLENKIAEVEARAGVNPDPVTSREQQQIDALTVSALELEASKTPANDDTEPTCDFNFEDLSEAFDEKRAADEIDLNQLYD